MRSPFLRCFAPFRGWLALIPALPCLAFAAPANDRPVPGGETINLPAVLVNGRQELPPPEAWQYTKLEDGTEVLSNASDRVSARMLRDFQLFAQALEVAWPMPAASHPPARTIILCGRHDKFQDFAKSTEAAPDLASTSLLLRNREQAAIIVDLQTTSLTLTGLNDTGGNGPANFAVDSYRQLYREYVRYLLSQGNQVPPPWLQEGISQILLEMEYTNTWIRIGRIASVQEQAVMTMPTAGANDGSEADDFDTLVADQSFNRALYRRALIPLDRFFAVPADAPVTKNPIGNNLWAKQAYAFVHMCLYGENGRFTEAFNQYTKRLASEPPSEALFKACFKMSYREMLMQLSIYVGSTASTVKQYTLKKGAKPLGGDPVVMRAATQAEVGRIKGDAQRLAGRVTDALASYHDAYSRGERDPALLAAFGVAAGETGQAERARPLLEAAFKAPGNRRPGAYVELARQRLAEAKARPAGPEGRLDPPQVNHTLEPLLVVRRLSPSLPETYEMVGEVWLASAGSPPNEHLGVLIEGLKLFPRDAILYYSLAEIYRRAGDNATAAKVARAGINLGADPAVVARLQALAASLPVSGPRP